MILILGGTTEGRKAAATLEEAGKPFYYSTRGDEQEVPLHNGIRLQGTLDADALETLCRQHDIRLLIDAAHPFAAELHRNVNQAAQSISIPVIRYERIFPERTENGIEWCDNYSDAIRRIKTAGIGRLLALTGVQSIGRLQELWKGECRCYFRILDRESSRALARQQQFPPADLYYYHAGEDEHRLLHLLCPDAVLLKESGVSGGFVEKVEAARETGIRIFAIRRPPMPDSFRIVDGNHGLRRMVEKLLPEFYPLHSGLTTGTCATAAAIAATWMLFHNETDSPPSDGFPVLLPCGETLRVDAELKYPQAEASVVKDAGDDPDITNGMQITARASLSPLPADRTESPASPGKRVHGGNSPQEDYPLLILAGEGIGTVTLPGLGIEVGAPAINATPRKMIEENVRLCLHRLHVPPLQAPLTIALSVPGGAEIAGRTFNPRLGIRGGISIIGTSGIVKPFSTDAFIQSIRKSMEVARATGSPRIVISSGAKSERTIKAYYPELPAQAFVHYGNFIGETLKIAAETGITCLTLGIMMGKAVKLAEGNLDTHSKKVTMNKAFIRQLARESGCGEETEAAIEAMNLARELWEIIPADRQAAFIHRLILHCHRHCDPLLPDGELTILLIGEGDAPPLSTPQ